MVGKGLAHAEVLDWACLGRKQMRREKAVRRRTDRWAKEGSRKQPEE
jgi:hypothetical protein